MKQFTLHCILAGTLCFASCQSQENSNATTTEPVGNDTATAALPPEPQAPDSAHLIVPGERIGPLTLNMPHTAISDAMGEPDSGNAAMGKSLQFWLNQGQPQDYLAVYIVNNFDGTGSPAKVKQIQVTSPNYKTSNGISTGSTMPAIREQFGSLNPIAYYTNKQNKKVYIFDDQAEGITFEVTPPDSTCVAITVHEKGKDITATYLPIHPDTTRLRQPQQPR